MRVDWENLKKDKRLKFNIGLAVVLVLFLVFFIDVIFSITRYRYLKEEQPKKEAAVVKKAAVEERKKPAPAEKKGAIKAAELKAPEAVVAIILDDAGGHIPDYGSIFSIKEPLTISVIPDLGTSMKIANEFRSAGFEVMLHLPMESFNGGYTRKDSGMIICSASDEDIKKTVLDDLASVGKVKGFNNHMGSKATADERVMKDVFGSVRGRGLYFIDSRTSSRSVALRAAKSCGISCAENNVFLDTNVNESSIEGKFRDLIDLARHKGSAIGIGHATRPATIAVLKKLMPEYAGHGIKFVHASELAK